MKRIAAFAAAALLAAACTHDNEEDLFNCAVDAANTRYATTIQPLLASYGCLGCHAAAGASGGVNLSTHAGVTAAIAGGRLYGSVSHQTGFSPMPKGGPKMNDCDLRRLKAWIDAGAPNN